LLAMQPDLSPDQLESSEFLLIPDQVMTTLS
jgi:hypothetical protein